MKKIMSLIISITLLLSSFSLMSGCNKRGSLPVSDVVLFEEGMNFTQSETRTPKEVYSLSYDIIGGNDVMPIGGFYAPYTSGGSLNGNPFTNFISEEVFDMIKEVGVNVLIYSPDRWGNETANKGIEKTLDLCGKYQIGYYVEAHWILGQMGSKVEDIKPEDMELNKEGGTDTLKNLVNEISDNGKRKGFIGLMSVDEPFESSLDNMKDLFEKFYELFGDTDYDLYTNSLGEWTDTNNFWGYSDPMEYDQYAEKFFAVKPRMYSVTQYPFSSENSDETQVVDHLYGPLSTYRRLANAHKVPHWRMLQAGGQFNDREKWLDTVPSYPSEGELLYDVNISLAYGAKGIQYFPLIQPQHFAYQTGGTYDYANRNGLIGGDGNKTRWFYYAKRANEQIRAIDEYLMNAMNEGIIVHGETATSYIVDPEKGRGAGEELIREGKFNELEGVYGDDCITGCFNYKGKTALYVVNYNRKDKANVVLDFDKDDYKYKVIQRATACDVVGGTIGLTLDAGEGALIVLS